LHKVTRNTTLYITNLVQFILQPQYIDNRENVCEPVIQMHPSKFILVQFILQPQYTDNHENVYEEVIQMHTSKIQYRELHVESSNW